MRTCIPYKEVVKVTILKKSFEESIIVIYKHTKTRTTCCQKWVSSSVSSIIIVKANKTDNVLCPRISSDKLINVKFESVVEVRKKSINYLSSNSTKDVNTSN